MILITGGGTGGHLSVAKAICEEYNDIDIRPIYIGSVNGLDKSWFEGYPGFSKTFFLNTKGVVNKNFFGKISSLTEIFKLTFNCIKIIKENNINQVFSVGGYAASPASFAAILTKTPLYIHEQNAISGKLNQILKPFAKAYFNSFDQNTDIKDYPIQKKFFTNKRFRKDIKIIIFLGGSQGANFINELAKQLAKDLNKNNIKIIHQCGKKDFENLNNFYITNNINVDLFAFSDEIDKKIKEADFAIARSGAGSLWELCASCIPCLFIPFPYAAKNHQFFNANFLFKQDLCYLLTQKEASATCVLSTIKNADIERISKSLENIVSPNGAKLIVSYIQNASVQ